METQISLNDFYWLLLQSKDNLRYKEQREHWNALLYDFKISNLVASTPIQHELKPLSLSDGIYQD